MAGGTEVFACPGCGRKFRWKADLAGRKVRCTACNLKVRIPAAAGTKAEALESLPQKPPSAKPEAKPVPKPPAPPAPPGDDESYDLNLDDDLAGLAPRGPVAPVPLGGGGAAAASGDGRCPSCNQKVKPGAVICINCGFNLQAGKKLKTKVEQEAEAPAGGVKASGAGVGVASANPFATTSLASANKRAEYDAAVAADTERQARIQNLWGPLGVLGAGIVLLLLNSLVLAPLLESRINATGIGGAAGAMAMGIGLLIFAGVRLVLQFPLLFIIIFVVAKLFSSSYGPIGSVLLKLLAIALFVGVFGDAIELTMGLITGIPSVGCFGGILKVSFVYAAYHILCSWLLEMDSGETVVSFLLLIFAPLLLLMVFGAMLMAMFA